MLPNYFHFTSEFIANHGPYSLKFDLTRMQKNKVKKTTFTAQSLFTGLMSDSSSQTCKT